MDDSSTIGQSGTDWGTSTSFAWGFPFFLGRAVYVGFQIPSSATPNGYFAY